MAQRVRHAESFRPLRRGWGGMLLALLVALGVWVLDQFGAVRAIDGLAYDRCLQVKAGLSQGPARVLLIDVDPEALDADDRTLCTLVRTVAQHDPLLVAFSFQPRGVSAELLEFSRATGRLIVGRECTRHPADPRILQLAKLGDVAGEEVPFGVVGLPPVRHGIYREQLGRYPVGERWLPSLEAAIAERVSAHAAAVPRDGYGIDFRGGPGSLPHLPCEAVLEGGLVRELVEGKVVLVGLRSRPTTPGISTPTTSDVAKMSPLEYHGHAANTLLTGRVVRRLGPPVSLPLLLAAAWLSFLVCQWSRFRVAFGLTLAMLLMDLLLAVGLLWWWQLWFPCVQLAVVQAVCFTVGLDRKIGFSSATVNRLLMDLSAELRRRRWPTGFFSDADPWPQVVSFLHQTLSLNRLIILELPADAYHVREVKAFNCSVTDIDERRRDCRRWPYAGAVESRGPLPIDANRPFLKLLDTDEQQYLVPLLFGEEVFGFLALGIARDQLESAGDFEPRLNDFARQVAELLYRRRCILSSQQDEGRLLRWFTRVPEETAYHDLSYAAHLLERRLARLENVFESSHTALAVYDMFGRLLVVNGRMRQVLRGEGLVPTELTTLDLISVLAKRDLIATRRLLREVILDKHPQTLPVKTEGRSGTYLLNIRPLELEVSAPSAAAAEATPFQLQGVLCELIDRSSIVDTDELRQQWMDHLGNMLRNDLAAVDFAASLLAGEDAVSDELQQLGTTIHDKIGSVVSTLSECQLLLSTDQQDQPEHCLPFAASMAVERAVHSAETAAEQRGVKIRVTACELTGSVRASPRLLVGVLQAVLELLLGDAREDTQITLTVAEDESGAVITAANEGVGVSPQRLRNALDPERPSELAGFRRIREAADWVRRWDGRMSLASQVGSGIVVKIFLRSCLPADQTDLQGQLGHGQDPAVAGKQKVLVVDDDPALRNLERHGLSTAGYDTVTAANGAEAMELIQRQQFDLVVVDLMMPVVGGLQFLRWLRGEAQSTIPAVVLTSHERAEVVAEAIDAGATKVLHKPIVLAEFLETIEVVLGR